MCPGRVRSQRGISRGAQVKLDHIGVCECVQGVCECVQGVCEYVQGVCEYVQGVCEYVRRGYIPQGEIQGVQVETDL